MDNGGTSTKQWNENRLGTNFRVLPLPIPVTMRVAGCRCIDRTFLYPATLDVNLA